MKSRRHILAIFMHVSVMDRTMAYISAHFWGFNCPETFYLTLVFRIAFSEALFSGGTSG